MSANAIDGDYWDIIEAALTSLPETNRLRAPALASFDHLKDRVLTNGPPRSAAVEALLEAAKVYAEVYEWWENPDARVNLQPRINKKQAGALAAAVRLVERGGGN